VPELIDSHAHLDGDDFRADLPAVVDRARAVLGHVVLVGLWRGPGDFGNARELAAGEPALFSATVGVHPHDCARVPEADWAECERLARDPATVAVGETGLDYHYDHSPRPAQRAAFARSVGVARRLDLPLVVHVREAHADAAALLAAEGAAAVGGVIHCFTGDADDARRYLDLGFHVSVAGIVTFKNADALRAAVRLMPADRLLVETDAPYLAPVPHRGRRNEPANVRVVAEAVAATRGEPFARLAEATAANARRLFRLARQPQ